MHGLRPLVLALALTGAAAAPAFADATAFIGATTTPANRSATGFSLGAGFLIVSFEFEYSETSDDLAQNLPSLKTFVGAVLLQTPVPIFGIQPYFAFGDGVYRERLNTETDTGLAPNTGGGVKISLAGPIRLRVDYRVFRLGSGALYSPAHRIYAGLNLKF